MSYKIKDQGTQETLHNIYQLEAQMDSLDILGNALLTGKPTKRLLYSLAHDYGYQDIPETKALDTYTEAVGNDILEGEWNPRRHYALLCTGGPHCEVRAGRAVCYGWFGAGEVSRPIKASERRALEYLLA